MKIEEIADQIVNIPHNFRTQGNKSIYSLLNESGYMENSGRIDEYLIASRLSQHREAVAEWLRYSKDKRTSSGWYFREDGSTYLVAHLGARGDNKTLRTES